MLRMSVAKLIEDLGGTTAVAEALGAEPPVVSNWRTRGIPPKRWPALVEFAKKSKIQGITFERLARTHPEGARA
jgi:hypothetical protein